jgi:hypothetical protein
MWQDIVLSTVGTLFCAALVPAVTNKYSRIPRKTSVPTAIGLAATACAYASLGLSYAAVVSAVCCGMWAYIAVFRPAGSQLPPAELR